MAYQQSQEQLKEIQELLEALKSELATDATQSLQEELESLTEQLAEIELQKENLNRDIETMKSDKDVLQQKVQNLQEQLAELRLQQTEWLSQQSYEQTDARRLEETISQLEVEEHQLQLLIEQGEAKVQTVDVEQLDNQLTQAQAKKTDLEQGSFGNALSWMIWKARPKMWQNRWNKRARKTKSGFVNKPRLKRHVKSMRIV